MSIIEILKNRFGKRPRDTDEDPSDQDPALRIKLTKELYVPAPRRRSVCLAMQPGPRHIANVDIQSPPGAFPGTGEYSPTGVRVLSKDNKAIIKPKDKNKTIIASKEQNKATTESKAVEFPTTVTAVTPPEDTAAATLTNETAAPNPTGKKSTYKRKPATRDTQDATQNMNVSKKRYATKISAPEIRTQAPIETTTQQGLHKRRRSQLSQPYTTPATTSEDRAYKKARHDATAEQLPTPSPSPPRSIKEFLADPSSRIAKAHKAAEDAHATSKKISIEVEHLRESAKNNIFSRAQIIELERELEPVTEKAVGTPIVNAPTKNGNKNDRRGSASPDGRDKSPSLIEKATDKSTSHESEDGNKNGSDNSASPDQHNTHVRSQSVSPVSPNESSDDDSISTSRFTKSSTSQANVDPQMSVATSIATAVASAFSTHLAAQNETLAAQNEIIAKKMEEVSNALAQTNAKNLEAQQLITRLATQPPSHPPSYFIQPQQMLSIQVGINGNAEAPKQATDRVLDQHHEANLETKPIWAPQSQQLANGHCSTPPIKDYLDPKSSLRKNRAILPPETSRLILEAHEVQYRYQLEECPVQKRLGFPRLLKQEPSFYASLKNRIVEPLTPDRSLPMEYEATGPPAVIRTWKPDQGIVFGQGTQEGPNDNVSQIGVGTDSFGVYSGRRDRRSRRQSGP